MAAKILWKCVFNVLDTHARNATNTVLNFDLNGSLYCVKEPTLKLLKYNFLKKLALKIS